MASDADVRAWARGEGIEVPVRGKLNPLFHQQYNDVHPDDVEHLADEDAGEQLPAAVEEEFDTGETMPRSPRSRGLLPIGRKARRAPKAKPRRISLEAFLSAGWTGLSAIVTQGGFTPTGRVLAMQAPVAGVILEDSLKGSVADRVLQPLARAAARGGQVSALLGPPVLVSLLATRPEMAPQLLPMLRMTLRQWVIVAGPALKAQEKKEAKILESLGVEEVADMNAVIEGMIANFFAPPDAVQDADAA